MLASSQLEVLDAACGPEQASAARGAPRPHTRRCARSSARWTSCASAPPARERELDLLEYELREIEEADPSEAEDAHCGPSATACVTSSRCAPPRSRPWAPWPGTPTGGDGGAGAALGAAARELDALEGVDARAGRAGRPLALARRRGRGSRGRAARLRRGARCRARAAGRRRGAPRGARAPRAQARRDGRGGARPRRRAAGRGATSCWAPRRRSRMRPRAWSARARSSTGSPLELREERLAAAPRLAAEVRERLEALAMEGAAFEIELAERDAGPTGADAVEFLIAPNAGRARGAAAGDRVGRRAVAGDARDHGRPRGGRRRRRRRRDARVRRGRRRHRGPDRTRGGRAAARARRAWAGRLHHAPPAGRLDGRPALLDREGSVHRARASRPSPSCPTPRSSRSSCGCSAPTSGDDGARRHAEELLRAA